jgi:hypothetical protein
MKNDSQSERQASRRGSLRYHSDQEQPEIPAYLKAVSASEEEEALASAKVNEKPTTKSTSDSNHKTQGVITITMGSTSIISVLFGIAIVAVSCFGAGFLVSQTFYQGQKKPAPVAVAVKPAPTIPVAAADLSKEVSHEDNRTRLADMAQNISGNFETKEPVKAEVKPAEAAKPATPEVKAITPDIGKTDKTKEDAKQENADAIHVPPLNQPAENKAPEVKPSGYFTIDLVEALVEQEAKDIQVELKKAGIDTVVKEIPAENYKPAFHVQSGKYARYDEAQKALEALPKPYSLWGSVMKIETDKGSQETRG